MPPAISSRFDQKKSARKSSTRMSNSKVKAPLASRGSTHAGSHGRRLLSRRVSEGLFVDVNSFETMPSNTPCIGGRSLGTPPLLVAPSSSSNDQGHYDEKVKDDVVMTQGENVMTPPVHDREVTQTNDTDIEALIDASVHDEDPQITKLSNEFKNLSVSCNGQTKITQYFFRQHPCYKSKTDCKKQGVVKSIFKTARDKTLDGFKRLSQDNHDKSGTSSMAAFSQ